MTKFRGFIGLLLFVAYGSYAQNAPLTSAQKEEFLRKARVVATRDVNKGVTGTSRLTMTDGVITHDASLQKIDEYRTVFQAAGGKSELNFKDTYRFNVAAWKLANEIGLGFMTPPSVNRKFGSDAASYTWWVDDVQFDEGERMKRNATPPDSLTWQRENALVKMFDQLIANTDRNVGNLLIDKNWHVWMIDHSRAFRIAKTLTRPESLSSIDRQVLENIKGLTEAKLQTLLKGLVVRDEIRALLARRDLIVKIFESKGETALFSLSPAAANQEP